MSRPSDQIQVYHVSFTWNKTDDTVEAEFIDDPEKVGRAIKEQFFDARFVYQLERGTETGRLHYQGNIHFTKTKRRPLSVASALRPKLKGIFLSCDSTKGREQANFYCMKNETKVAGPWYDDSHVEEDWSYLQAPRGWQLPLWRMLTAPAARRQMIWIWEEAGCTGKSEFGTYMEVHHKVIKLGLSTAPDNLYAVSEMTANRPNGFIFDVPRSVPKRFDWAEVYMSMEQIKDGNFLSTKYKPKKVLYSHCMHIVVFSNQAPDYSALSADRWRVYKISGDTLTTTSAEAAITMHPFLTGRMPGGAPAPAAAAAAATEEDEDYALAGAGAGKCRRITEEEADELLGMDLPLMFTPGDM